MITTDSQNQATRLLIIGDIVIDETWHVRVRGLSPEGPVPIAMLEGQEPVIKPGGAGLAATYAARSNINVHLLTACGSQNKKLLEENGVPTTSVAPIVNVVKKRYIDIDSGYHLIRVDNDDVVDKPNIVTENICPQIEKILDQKNISVVSMLDYRKGMFFNEDTCRNIISLCHRRGVKVYVDTRCSTRKFMGVDYLKLNKHEYKMALKELEVKNKSDIVNKLEIGRLIVTKGRDGALIHYGKEDDYSTFFPQHYSGTPDVTGCGDVFGVMFCDYISRHNNKYENKRELEFDAVKKAVDEATYFAYQDTESRI